MMRWRRRPVVACVLRIILLCAAGLSSARRRSNVLLVIIDNLRPALRVYGDTFAKTPHMDSLAEDFRTTVYAKAYSQISWCAPSRNSFLTGRRPARTESYGFRDHFREVGPGWTTLPGYFKEQGYTVRSYGKVFHPSLPPNFDYPQSWTHVPFFQEKPTCPNGTMTCAYDRTDKKMDVDTNVTDVFLKDLEMDMSRNASHPFFAALGYQSPRLPWSYPSDIVQRYPPTTDVPIANFTTAEGLSDFEWFRPTEINMYTDIENVSHSAPLSVTKQQLGRLAYYAAVSHVDDQIGRVLSALKELELAKNTVLCVVSDHGQSLGEKNLWSMMGLLDQNSQVPMLIRRAELGEAPFPERAQHHLTPVELIDLFPTLVSLAGIPSPPSSWNLPGRDLAGTFDLSSTPAAFSQITRCSNCALAYRNVSTPTGISECDWDADTDGRRYFVPCCMTPKDDFEYMGVSVRVDDWRYTKYCRWYRNRVDFTKCVTEELFDHRTDDSKYFEAESERTDVSANASYRETKDRLAKMLTLVF